MTTLGVKKGRKTMEKMRNIFAVLAFLSVFTLGTVGLAAGFPERPIRMIVFRAAGGGDDIIARMFQPAFEKVLGQKVLVENIPGGATKIGVMALMKSKPDGYTLACSSTESFVVSYYSGTFDSKVWEEMVPIGNLSFEPFTFVEVRSESPFKSWADLVKASKENPGKITCGGPGGSWMEMVYKVVAKAAGMKTAYVPFPGGGPAKIALLGGHVDLRFCNPGEAIAMVRAGKTRGLAVSSSKRMDLMPDVPTFKELGIGKEIELTRSIWGPPGLPSNMISTITKMIETATKNPEFIKLVNDQLLAIVDYRLPEKIKEGLKNFEMENKSEMLELYIK
jgi:tripartite-type tricarboxylate transporter receptor subunit TctC